MVVCSTHLRTQSIDAPGVVSDTLEQASHRVGRGPRFSWLLQPTLTGPQAGQRIAPSHRPVNTKHLSGSPVLSNGDTPVSGSSPGVDDVPGSQGRILPRANRGHFT